MVDVQRFRQFPIPNAIRVTDRSQWSPTRIDQVTASTHSFVFDRDFLKRDNHAFNVSFQMNGL